MIQSFRPSDPLYVSQWHLAQIGSLGMLGGPNLGIERIWSQFTGAGVRVGIWDDGVQSTHWDLVSNYYSSLHITVLSLLNNGQPLTSTNGHGTSVGGLIGADNNNRGGVGVAFDASLTGVRIFGGADDINLQWLRYLITLESVLRFDITNHSYGAYPSFSVMEDVALFEDSARLGRGGLGTVTVKAAGNHGVDGNGDALDSSRHTISVAATDANGFSASYSAYGAHILISAPAGAVTTDLLGNGTGYDGLLNGDYTAGFGGTSAAAPITSGVIALMLQANRLLGWRDVQDILVHSAVGAGSLYGGVASSTDSFVWKSNRDTDWNGGGLFYSQDYGYGMLNAYNATRMSEVWSLFNPVAATSANERVARVSQQALGLNLTDNGVLSYQLNFTQDLRVEHIGLTLGLQHDDFREMEVWLRSPAGSTFMIFDGSSATPSTAAFGLNYTLGVESFRDETSAGTWWIDLFDTVSGGTGQLHELSMQIYGSDISVNDTYHYTDEIFLAASLPGQAGRLRLTDQNGGTDWLNAAALYQDLVLDLRPGTSSTMGGLQFVTLDAQTWLEHAVSGDGFDRVTGNDLANHLLGMRSNDTLVGGLGNDTLDGGSGIDVAVFSGLYNLYQLQQLGSDVLIVGPDGTDILR